MRYEIDKESKADEGIVVVTFINDNGIIKDVKDYKYIKDNTVVYDEIAKGNKVNLNNCYVEKFSMYDFKEFARHLEVDANNMQIKLSAEKTFFNNGAYFSNVIFLGEVNFSQAIFLGNVHFKGASFIGGDVSFDRARFGDGDVFFSDATFGEGNVSFLGSRFGDGDVVFSGTNFGDGDVDFFGSNFGKGYVFFSDAIFGEGNISFDAATFGEGRVDFSGTTFVKGDVKFSRTIFGDGDVEFLGAKFREGNVSFDGATFGEGSVNFLVATFREGNVSFMETTFGKGDLMFNKVDFGKGKVSFIGTVFETKRISFYQAIADELILQNCILKCHVDLVVKKANLIVLYLCYIHETIEMKFDSNAVIEGICLHKTKILGQVYIHWDENNVKQLIENGKYYKYSGNGKYYDYNGIPNWEQNQLSNKQFANQFVILKENFHSIGKYDDEDKAYVEYKRNIRKSKIYDKKLNVMDRIGNHIIAFFDWFIGDLIGEYGTNYKRVALTMFYVVLGFANLYRWTGFTFDGVKICGVKALYYSGITFLTIGYGEIHPTEWYHQLLSVAEGFLGIFLMSYFTVSFVRKLLR